MNQRNPKLFAVLFIIVFFGLIMLYVREFPVISNTLGARWLVIGSMAAALLVSGGLIWRSRERFTPIDRHRPDVAGIIIMSMFFAPLLGSWLNRTLGKPVSQPFEFVAETPYFATGYGILKGEKLTPSGYHLFVKEKGTTCRFEYKSQAYYPITKPGEVILLPICNGFFGARVMLLK